MLHATAYCGIPTGLDAFRAAHEILVAEGVLGARGEKQRIGELELQQARYEASLAERATDLFEMIRTTRSMRRLKPDPVPNEAEPNAVVVLRISPEHDPCYPSKGRKRGTIGARTG